MKTGSTAWSGGQNRQVRRFGTRNRRERNRLVERDESPIVCDGQGKQVCARHLLRAVNTRRVDGVGVKNAYRTRPEIVMAGSGRAGQHIDRVAGRDRARIPRLTDDSDEAVLCDGARRPPLLDLAVNPGPRSGVVDVVAIEEGQQDVHIQQRAHQSNGFFVAESVDERIRDGVTAVWQGSNPWNASSGLAADCACWPTRAWRARSDRTSPTVRFSRRARSLTASRTSSSIDKVVRTYLIANASTVRPPNRLPGSYASRHVDVHGGGDVMNEPGVPLLVRRQVGGQCVTIRAGRSGLSLSLFHGAAPPCSNGYPTPPWHERGAESTVFPCGRRAGDADQARAGGRIGVGGSTDAFALTNVMKCARHARGRT
jgi:hypothetical protein